MEMRFYIETVPWFFLANTVIQYANHQVHSANMTCSDVKSMGLVQE